MCHDITSRHIRIRKRHDRISQYELAKYRHNNKKSNIEAGEPHHILFGSSRDRRAILPECDKTCKRSNERAGTADIYTVKQRTVIIRKTGKQYRRRTLLIT